MLYVEIAASSDTSEMGQCDMNRRSLKNIQRDLRKISMVGLSSAILDDHVEALEGESDRGVIILLSTQLEDVILFRIKRSLTGFTTEDADGFFGSEGPCGSFAAKIKLAKGIGIINAATQAHLEMVRHMRNACAHAPSNLSFSSPLVREAALSFFTELAIETYVGATAGDVRKGFLNMCGILSLIILKGDPQRGMDRFNQIIEEMAAEAAEEKR